jgi:hypothetical protein
MIALRARWCAGVLVVGVAAVGFAAPAGSSVRSVWARAGGAAGLGEVAVRRGSPAAPAAPAISVEESAVYPVNALCTSVGIDLDNTATVDGTGFAHSGTATVRLSGKKKATAATNTTGAFQATFGDPSQPTGAYPVTAKTGRRQAATTVFSSGSACVSGSGTFSNLKWKMQGVGFDAGTEADLLVNGVVYESTTTSSRGAFKKTFHKGCPGVGSFPIQFQGSFEGTVSVFGNGTLTCND